MSYRFKLISVFIDPKLGYKGNTAAIVELDKTLSDKKMQALASDFNQPATTFLWRNGSAYKARWFAPDAEIGLCGHGSLAAFAYLNEYEETELAYNHGVIKGQKNSDNSYSMLMSPIISKKAGQPDQSIVNGLNKPIKEYYSNSNKDIVVLENEDAVATLEPDFSILKNMDPFGIIVTSRGDQSDFVSRTLVPKVQQLEDHATGSSHAALTPFWAERLNKSTMTGYQLSKRGGKFICNYQNNIVTLSGEAKVIASGEIHD